MNIYIRLKDYEQAELLSLLPSNHHIAMQIRVERENAETKAWRLSHEQIEADVRIYVDSGGVIHYLPPDPKLAPSRRATNGGTRRCSDPVKPKLSSVLKSVDRDVLIAMLKQQLQENGL